MSINLLDESDFILPDWPAPTCVKAFVSTRKAGFSQGAYRAFNLSLATGDDPEFVTRNRETLVKNWGWSTDSLCWLKQVHGTRIINASVEHHESEADGIFSTTSGWPCMVTTADCLPVLLCNLEGSFVAAIHAGWKGLAAGVLSSALNCYSGDQSQLLVWFGPAISKQHFEVGPEVYATFVALGRNRADCFQAGQGDRWYADLVALAKLALIEEGVKHFFGGKLCTYEMKDRFYSYRRDGQKSGRMASAIWID